MVSSRFPRGSSSERTGLDPGGLRYLGSLGISVASVEVETIGNVARSLDH